MALLILPVDGEPCLFVSEQTLAYAASVTTFDVRPLQGLDGALKEAARNLRGGSMVLAGSAYIVKGEHGVYPESDDYRSRGRWTAHRTYSPVKQLRLRSPGLVPDATALVIPSAVHF